MDDTKKMLQLIINSQSAMKAELLTEIHKVDQKVDKLDTHDIFRLRKNEKSGYD